ncbi:proteasome subunit beta type-3 [Otolemur garnettii]|uniref:proteasome subunit beta type-3 n=1 Tax=Otolemur garnettii TaxID=30611 RepID=UPI0006443337|nr:proteasome subunit beta type-3 [Otolemur garnettii]
MSIMSYNGGAVMAMKGKNCVAIAADRRFGIQAQMVTTDFQKIFPMGDRLYIGLAGLATDVQTDPEHLFETISQAMLNAVDRDAVSGMGVIVHIIEKDKITTRTLKARMD